MLIEKQASLTQAIFFNQTVNVFNLSVKIVCLGLVCLWCLVFLQPDLSVR